MYGGTGTIRPLMKNNEGFLVGTKTLGAKEMKTGFLMNALLAASVFLNCAILSFALVLLARN
jgi:hypothetical protein